LNPKHVRAVGLLVAMASLLVVPGMADASTSASCKVIGQTKRVVAKKKTDYLICSLSGKRKVWKATTPAVGTKATVLKAGGLPFVDLALSVKNFAAQCVLVMKGNEVVAEWNFGNHTPSTKILLASVSKSFTNTLVGIAQKKGLVNIDDKASKFITEWVGTNSESVTIRHLLAMTSTRSEFNLANSLQDLRSQTLFPAFGGAQHATSPGLRWAYHNASTQALEIVLSRATGESVSAFAQRELFAKLGMTTTIEKDLKGIEVVYAGFTSTCLDVAKLTRLYLQKGMWDGQQILTPEYVVDSLTPQVTSTAVNASMNGSYGLQIWLNSDKGTSVTVGRTGSLYPDLPTDMFWFQGACRQFGVGVPSKDLTVVMLRPGCDTLEKAFLDQLDPSPATVFIYQLGKAISSLR
jgi:CubicO group peptidase (beta-lactamase class C family)